MTDSPRVTWPSPAITTLSSRRTQRTVVERIRRGAAFSAAWTTGVFFFMSAILNYTAQRDGETGAPPVSRPPRFRTLDPNPAILRRSAHQPRAHRIVGHVSNLSVQVPFSSESSVKRLLLPNTSNVPCFFVDAVCRDAFDLFHDLWDATLVPHRRECEMNVVWHHDERME